MSSPPGVTNSSSVLPPPPHAVTNYSSISYPANYPPSQDGTDRTGGTTSLRSIRAKRRAAWVRSLTALGAAVVVALLVGLAVESINLLRKRRAWDDTHLPAGYDVPREVRVHECASSAQWEDISPIDTTDRNHTVILEDPHNTTPKPRFPPFDFPFAARTSFDLSLDSGDNDGDISLMLLSRGRWLTGAVKVVASQDQNRGRARVDVVARYLREDTRNQVKVCLVRRDEGGRGVGVFTPEHEWRWEGDSRRRHVHYEITVSLPKNPEQPLVIKKLETDIPNGLQELEFSDSGVRFTEVTLRGSNGAIYSNQTDANRVSITATDTSISGTFVVNERLKIETSNASVRASIWAKHSKGLEKGPGIDIQTSNSSIEGIIHLLPHFLPPSSRILPQGLAVDEEKYGPVPTYDIRASTANALLNLTVTSDFADSIEPTIHIDAANSEGTIFTEIRSPYSGTYDLHTRDGGMARLSWCDGPIVIYPSPCWNRQTEDHRKLTSNNHLKGYLDSRHLGSSRSNGSIALRTSGGPAILSV